ncbi:ribonuclease, Rne/Rng family [Tistlia consotensis]|uniref:Ribonuclease, Rne/Rng family n=1 Tax=Tistlia consotensis USBA 355 TaxID=560819 RepID=A0A1Y6CX43_9PROT|nr:ribonuclease E/G [Tistlia consotensis]SMF83497.1 ribonuclease, Rne/Rng family [Tistlia consotensis USBA 355]SNS33868.1 ribonuclease, Rne/Rng family [Tistlia consotensis]
MTGRWLVSGLPGELRWAALDAEGRALDFRVERADRPGAAGDLCLGRVVALDKDLEAAFVDIGLARPGFLPLAGLARRPGEGEALAVRVLRAAAPDKGVKLAAAPDAERPSGVRPPVLLARSEGLLEALLALTDAPEAILVDDEASLRRLQAALAARPELLSSLRLAGGAEAAAVEAGLSELLAALLDPEVALAGGGRLWIEPTRALVAVDVDRGAARDADALNEAAATMLARQLRLRDLSGLIAVDFLDPSGPAARAALRVRFEAALAEQAEGCELGRLGGDGLALVTRRRARPALHELVSEPAPGGGWRREPAALAFELLRRARLAAAAPRLRLLVSRRVALALQGPGRAALEALGARRGHAIELVEEAARADELPEIVLG